MKKRTKELVDKARKDNAGKKAYQYEDENQVWKKELPLEKYVLIIEDQLEGEKLERQAILDLAIALKEKSESPRKKGADANKNKGYKNYKKFVEIVIRKRLKIDDIKKDFLEDIFHPEGLLLKKGQLYNYLRRLKNEKKLLS